MVNIKIRASRIEDIDELKALMRSLTEYFKRPFYEKQWIMDIKYKFESAPESIIVAEDTENNELVGMILVDIGRDPYSGAIIAQLNNFIVKKEWRGKGIGSKLIQRAIELCRDKKVKEIHTNARKEIDELLLLFEKFDFVESHVVMKLEL
ncbi:MAG: GNAT family N-acetyltransferase [Candidatus Helarchaeota archaeon]